MFEVFPWSPHLETGIAIIDEQHRRLVLLINRLAQQHVEGATEAEIRVILSELSQYADYHFRTEEQIWQSVLAGDARLDEHSKTHQAFFAHIGELQSVSRPFQTVLEDLFSYLIRWLAYHILESDKRMAMTVLAIREGLPMEAARAHAEAKMQGATATLIQTVLGMYQTLSTQALELMHEKLARQRAESALQSSELRWRGLFDDAGTQPQDWVSTVRRLRAVIDNVPAGLIAADMDNHRFVFSNHWFCQMLGYSQEELLGMNPADIHPHEVLSLIQADYQHMRAGLAKAALTIPVRRKDGSLFMANIERVPVALDGHTSMLAIFTDITERYRAEQALKASESHLRTLVNTIPDLIWLKDVNGVYLSCNPAFERFFGAPEAAIVGKTDYEFVPRELADSFSEHDQSAMAVQHPLVNEVWVTLAVGGQRTLLETTKAAMIDPDGKLLGVLGISHDITELRTAAAALEAERLRLQNAIDAAQAGTWEWDLSAGVVRYSERTTAMLGYNASGMQQGSYESYVGWIHPEDRLRVQQSMTRHLSGEQPHFEGEMRMRHADGHWVWCRSRGRVMQRSASGAPLLVAGISVDISEHKMHREQIDYVSRHDVLTGLPNRVLFIEMLGVSMDATHEPQHLAVAYIDLDDFASINESQGRDVGNQLILHVSRCLTAAVQLPHQLAHIGGDEFAVILSGLTQADGHVTLVKHLLDVVAQQVTLHELSFTVTASSGVALYRAGDRADAEQLLRQADHAMYLAKLAGKNRHHLFDPVTDESTRERFTRLDEISRALVNDEFVLYYQPKVNLSSGEVIGFEALIRWQHPQRGLLAPGMFIPLLDRHPLAIALGDWVIEAALAQLAFWNTQGLETAVSVNIDAMQLHDPDFADRLERQIQDQPTVSPQQLELEILETGALENMAHVSALVARLQSMGIECALDDFGTGYSSLTFLKQLTARTVKIDQSFVRGMLTDAEDATIVNSVLALARNFDRRALAEGIETEANGTALIEFGCTLGQGYMIARPMPAQRVADWRATWRVPEAWVNSHAVGPRDIPLLLAEAEHRGWLNALRAQATQGAPVPPPDNRCACRFGAWLERPATQQRFKFQTGFAHLQATHRELHLFAAEILTRLQADAAASVAGELAALTALSDNLLAQLHRLRQTQSDIMGSNSGFAEL
jgi:diguanylate cyclase (GGDEF)-like protein/hemerythrin-like metal-binding protein/PAS domain S-box-containing protein